MLSIGVLIVLELVGGVLLLTATAFLALTAYTYYVHWKHSHIPSPKLTRFAILKMTDNKLLYYSKLLYVKTIVSTKNFMCMHALVHVYIIA